MICHNLHGVFAYFGKSGLSYGLFTVSSIELDTVRAKTIIGIGSV
jgi:hypothetical protein